MRDYAEDATIQRYRHATGLSERQQLGEALLNKSLGVNEDGHPDEAIQLLDEVVTLFRRAEQADLKLLVATALQRKAAMLRGMGRDDAALASHEEIIARYGGDAGAEDPRVQAAVGEAYHARGYAHQLREESREAKIAYLNGRTYLVDAEGIDSERNLASVLLNLSFCHARDADRNGARLFLDELEDRFSESTDAFIMETLGKARELRAIVDPH